MADAGGEAEHGPRDQPDPGAVLGARAVWRSCGADVSTVAGGCSGMMRTSGETPPPRSLAKSSSSFRRDRHQPSAGRRRLPHRLRRHSPSWALWVAPRSCSQHRRQVSLLKLKSDPVAPPPISLGVPLRPQGKARRSTAAVRIECPAFSQATLFTTQPCFSLQSQAPFCPRQAPRRPTGFGPSRLPGWAKVFST